MKKFNTTLAAILLFLLPLKFGGLAVMTEAGGFYPDNFTDWIFITWHPHAAAYIGTVMLFFALLENHGKLALRQLIFVVSWVILPVLAVLPGMIRGESVIALGEVSLLLGAGSFVAAAALMLHAHPERSWIFTGAIIAGGVAAAFYGWHQHLYSLDETRRFVQYQESIGIPVSEGMRLKLTDPRIYSTLASSNTFASFLMIILVPAIYGAVRWSKKVTPPKAAKITFIAFAILIFVPVLLLTRSRSIVVCPVLAGILAVFSLPEVKLRWKVAGLTAGILIVIAGILLALRLGRGIESMGERADYWRTSAILCKNYPLTGAGWGGFFRTHMTIKVSKVIESARDPHNVVAKYASQCGIPAGLIMLAVLLWPLVMLWKHRFSPGLPGAVFWSGVIFTLHSFIDCDWQVPALIAIMGILYLCALTEVPECEPVWKIKTAPVMVLSALIAVAGVWSSYRYLAGDYALAMLQDRINPPSRETALKLAPYSVEILAEEAAAIRPGSAVIPMYLGDWYTTMGAYDHAEAQYFKALELDPVRPAAFARLARIELKRGNSSRAEELMMRAHRIYPLGREYTLEKLYQNRL